MLKAASGTAQPITSAKAQRRCSTTSSWPCRCAAGSTGWWRSTQVSRAVSRPGFAAIAGQPGDRTAVHEAALHRVSSTSRKPSATCPGRLHDHARGGGRQFRHAGQQRRGLGSGDGDQDLVERTVVLSLGVLQVPVLLAAEDLGDAAGKTTCRSVSRARVIALIRGMPTQRGCSSGRGSAGRRGIGRERVSTRPPAFLAPVLQARRGSAGRGR